MSRYKCVVQFIIHCNTAFDEKKKNTEKKGYFNYPKLGEIRFDKKTLPFRSSDVVRESFSEIEIEKKKPLFAPWFTAEN